MPPVRLFREGEELTDVWDLIRTNIRMAQGSRNSAIARTNRDG